MTQPTDKVREAFENCHLEMNLRKTSDGDYFFEGTADCYRSYLAGRTAALDEAIAKFYKLDSGVMETWDIERVLKELRDGN